MNKTVEFNYTGAVQTFTAPYRCECKIECWGAEGGTAPSFAEGGKGGYSTGKIKLKKGDYLYIYVGQRGVNGGQGDYAAFNGGGAPQFNNQFIAGGGGATDVRTAGGAWNISLNTRIIVAGGGGGGGAEWGSGNEYAGDGGGINGQDAGWRNGHTGYNCQGRGGTQYGAGGPVYGGFGYGGVSTTTQCGSGGGGWYGGGGQNVSPDAGGGGGSGYIGGVLEGVTTSGVNTGNGKVIITISTEPTTYFLEKDGLYYIPISEHFDFITETFIPVSLATIKKKIEDDMTIPFLEINKPFTINNKDGIPITRTPSKVLDFSKCKLRVMTLENMSKVTINYTPSNIALCKTNIKIKEQYVIPKTLINYYPYFDITTNDKSKIDYFIDCNNAKSYKNCSILNTEMISDSAYANFNLNATNSLLSSVTLYHNYKYKKIREDEMDVYDNFKDSAYVVFHDDYDLMLVNRVAKQELVNYIETLDKF